MSVRHTGAPAARPSFRATARSRTLAVAIAAALATPAAFAAGIHLNVGTLDTAAQAPAARLGQFEGKRLHLVQFSGPIQGEWVDALAADGVQVLDYLPDYAYIVYGDAAALQRLQSRAAREASIAWDGPWLAEYKVHPAVWGDAKQAQLPLAQRSAATDRFSIQLVADRAANEATRARLSALGAEVIGDPGAIPGRVNLDVALHPSALALVAGQPDVLSIHPYVEPTRFDERQNMILAGQLTGNAPTPGDYFARLTAWGFTQAQFNTSGFVVDVTDDGADRNPGVAATPPGTVPQDANAGPVLANHFVLWESGSRPIGAATPTGTSRFIYKSRWGTGSVADGGQGFSGHGQLNMSIVGGFVPTGTVNGVNFGALPHADAQGFRFGLGVAPYVRMANSVIFDPNFTSPNFANMLSGGYASGMRISSNSWGSNAGGAYIASSQTYDGLVRDAQGATPGNQEAVIVFSAGNAGAGLNTIGAPGTGKNVITVGAAENVHPFGGADGCGTTDAEADSANDIVGFSSRGPTDDGRFKPDIQAPGTHITGMAYVTPDSSGNGTSAAGYRADGVCAGVPPSNFFPLGQVWYTASSGTSHSAPAVSGAAALVRQQFINNPAYLATNRTPAGPNPPSPAMTKAYLVNSARYMTGVSANDNLPSQTQGMGMVNLGTAFDATPRALRDQAPADLLANSGDTRSFTGTISDPARPFRVTLAWTDAPGSTTGNAFVNNLDLVVRAGGNTYLGNVFTGASSVTGGAADPRNNVESVFVPAGVTGPYSVLVRGANIAGDGVPGDADTTDQDFALVAYNAATISACPAITVNAPTLPATTDFGAAIAPVALAASGGTAPYTFSAAGALPPGLSIVGSNLQGTPTLGGTFTVGVQAIDANGCITVRSFPLVVRAANLARGVVAVTSGNNLLEPSECNTISVPLTNGGDLGATAISSTLTSTTPGVTIATASSAYPNIPPAGNASNTTLFQVGTAGSVQCASLASFTQTVTYAGGESPRTFDFTLPVGTTGLNYNFTTGAGAAIPAGGVLLAGSQADDATVTLTVPAGFSFQVYDTPVAGGSTIRAGTNGGILVSTGTQTLPFGNAVLPASTLPAGLPAVLAYWDDLDMAPAEVANGGIYTQLVGTAPNRQWIIEWRARPYVQGTPAAPEPVNLVFAAVFTEGSNGVEYRYTTAEPTGSGATVGIQASNTGTRFTQFSANTASITPGLRIIGALPPAQCTPGPSTCLVDPIFSHGFEPAPPVR